MDFKGRNVMYLMKPVYEPNTQFQNSSSMYKLKNLQMSTILTNNHAQANVFVEDDTNILARQEKLLANLYQLQKDVFEFEKKLKELKFAHSIPTTDSLDLFIKAEIRDFVINADPNYAPYALLWLQKLWNISLNVNIHSHSSVQSLPERLFVFDKLRSNFVDSRYPHMTFVWKEVGEDTELIVSPIKCKTVLGEVNVLRFFDYILNSEENTLEYIRKNEVLDLAHRLNHAPRSGSEQQSIVKELEKRLGKEKWMCGSVPTIADAAVWSALIKLGKNVKPANLNKYVTSCSEFVDVKISS